MNIMKYKSSKVTSHEGDVCVNKRKVIMSKYII